MLGRPRGSAAHCGIRCLLSCLVAVSTFNNEFLTRAANWAQTSGVKEQQTALIGASPFAARHGHACVVIDSGIYAFDYIEAAESAGYADGENAGLTEASVDSLFCIGGDTYSEVDGGGGLTNDVWQTAGINWRIATTETILNEYDAGRVTTVSDMYWNQLLGFKGPPTDVSYMEWIACDIEETGLHPPPGIECRLDRDNSDLWSGKRFSPRRHHGVVAFQASGDVTTRIWVLGGRSRVLIDYPEGWERVHGGFRNRYVDPFLREENALMNDIWVSPPTDDPEAQKGIEWALVNPGCVTRYYPFTLPAEPELWGNGSAAAVCSSDSDCGGDATCDTSMRVCICNIWSPREQHAVAVFKNKIYVTGGYVWVDLHTCNGRSCGGGFRKAMSDVWWSTDAFAWLNIGWGTADAEFGPRAGHQLVVPYFSNLYSLSNDVTENLMYVVGGQSHDLGLSDTTEFLGDVWVTSDGARWVQTLGTGDEASYPARSSHFAAIVDDVMVVTGGYDADGGRSDTWTWDRSPDSLTSGHFVEDFSNETEFADYVDENSPVSVIPFVNDLNEEKLNSLGIYTIQDLSEIQSWQVKKLQDFADLDYPDICLHIKWAEAVMNNCIAVIEPPDYVDWNGTFERQDDWDARLKENQTKSEAQITEETDYCVDMFLDWTGSWTNYILFDQEEPYPFPLKCKSKVGMLSMPTGVVYQDRVWVIGGLQQHTAPAEKTSNVWYREPHVPTTSLEVKPLSGSADSLFEFGCSDSFSSWCRYQYRIFDMSELPPIQVRHWSDTNSTLDYGAYWSGGWLPRGDYRLQVRAIGPSGNKEVGFQEGRNQHTWTHMPTPPWNLIISIIVFVLLVIIGVIVYERYKARKAALQRYAMKRMRRKFKRMQKIKAGKLHKDRVDRAKESKKDAVVKEVEQNQEAEEKEAVASRSKRRRRRGPAQQSTVSAVNGS